MNRKHKNALGILLAAWVLLFCSVPMCVRAEGTTTIHVSSSNVTVGDTLSVTVTATESGSISLTYNAEVLQFSDCSTTYTTNGNVVTFDGSSATIRFSCIAQGNSSLIVSSPTVTGSSTSIRVGGQSTTPVTDTQPTSTSDDVEGQFQIDGVGYVVSERYPDSAIPAGFEKVKVNIDGYAYRELSNGTITLLYLKKASDIASDGTFYMYDAATNQVSPFVMLGDAQHYVVLSTPESLLKDTFVETTISVNGQDVKAYYEGTESDFYYVYGTNQDGESGWYQYDVTDGSVQRVNMEWLASEDATEDVAYDTESDNYFKQWQKQRYLLAAMLFVIVVLLVLVINLLLGRRQLRQVEDPEEYDDDSDAFDVEDENAIDDLNDQEESVGTEAMDTHEVADANESAPAGDTDVDAPVYSDIKGAEAFRSKKDTRYKTADMDAQIDILDLNDL